MIDSYASFDSFSIYFESEVGIYVQVSDFGLAKSFSDTNTHITHLSTRVVGTFG